MANTFPVTKLVALEFIRLRRAKKGLQKKVTRDYEHYFTDRKIGPIGDTINVKVMPRLKADDGAVVDYRNDLVVKTVPVSLKQSKVVMDLTVWEDNFEIDSVTPFIQQAVDTLTMKQEVEGFKLAKEFPNTLGSTTKSITKRTISNAKSMLDKYAVPDANRFLAVSTDCEAVLVESTSVLFNNQDKIADQYDTRDLGFIYGFDSFSSLATDSYTAGPSVGVDTITVDGANQSGDTLKVAGVTLGLNEGDTFTIEGIKGINPAKNLSTGQDQQFVVKSISSDKKTLSISPSINMSEQESTVSALPANGATLKFWGVAGTSYDVSLAAHKSAIAFVSVPSKINYSNVESYTITDRETGDSIRVTRDYNFNTDSLSFRFDAVYGWAILDDLAGVKILSVPGLLEE